MWNIAVSSRPFRSSHPQRMKRVLRKSSFLILVFLFWFFAYSQERVSGAPVVEESRLKMEKIVTTLQEKYEALESLQASFEQKNELKSLGRTTTSSGRLAWMKPGKLRMEYVKPEKQVLVSDGHMYWLYTARFKQVIVSRTGGSGFGTTPLLFLSGKGNLKKNFHVTVEEVGVARRSGGIWRAGQPHRIRLEPKAAGASFRRMWVEVEPENFRILTLAYIDNIGNKSHLRFSNVKENVRIAGEKFQFVVPPNVEVLQMPAHSGQR
ncbi:MAG: outer membrane lipoprotein carrier protein LolA [Nitrospinae bacterium]|nr:outer membrane lipoprotein carrier protein LolA [Nitrospinota bacterium]